MPSNLTSSLKGLTIRARTHWFFDRQFLVHSQYFALLSFESQLHLNLYRVGYDYTPLHAIVRHLPFSFTQKAKPTAVDLQIFLYVVSKSGRAVIAKSLAMWRVRL